MKSALAAGVCLLGGAYSVLLWQPPPPPWILVLAGIAGAGCLFIKRRSGAGPGCLGFVLMGTAAASGVAQMLTPNLAGTDLSLDVSVVDFPERSGQRIRMLVRPLASAELPKLIRLSWHDPVRSPQFGECWTLTVRLRRPRGFVNPGGFDYEGWLFRNHIGATGYIREGALIENCAAFSPLDKLRRRIADRLMRVLPDDDASAVMLAISVGARHRIGAAQWREFATTGTSHLMAISGMHIGLAALSTYFLSWILLALRPTGNHRVTAALASLAVALLYAALSGFAVPARRALIMLLVAVLAFVARRSVLPGHLLGLACLIVAVASPLDVLSPGFQLSFTAVAVLIVVARRSPTRRAAGARADQRVVDFLRGLTVLQFALLFGLLPLTVGIFSRTAWLSPAVNLIVLPVFNLVTVPTSLLGLLFDGPLRTVGDQCLVFAWVSVKAILMLVSAFAGLPHAERVVPELAGASRLCVWLCFIWIVLPVGWPGRRIAILAAAGALLSVPPRPPEVCVDVHTLDVGQGLATVVLTRNHVLVFDTGPAFRSGGDIGQLVVTPFLQSLGVTAIDMLVVSHADLDHAGGVDSVSERWRIDHVLSGEPLSRRGGRQSRCQTGQVWEWDGVVFSVLHPDAGTRRRGNNASCVVEIRAGDTRALLTGDIEAPIERRLLRQSMLSPVQLVVIPHHGSATSSGADFIARLGADVAIASTGFANRWGMPKPAVVNRWQSSGATVYDTATDGAVSFRLCAETGLGPGRRARADNRKLWRERR